jgi:Rrf2 family protein
MASGRFAMAVHALALLSQSDEGYPSRYIAGSVNTHAVVLRRVLGQLAAAGLIEAREGRGGGYRLARPPDRISLGEVYMAVEPGGPLSPSPAVANPRCPIGAGMSKAFLVTSERAREGLIAALARQSVAETANAALRHGRVGKAD